MPKVPKMPEGAGRDLVGTVTNPIEFIGQHRLVVIRKSLIVGQPQKQGAGSMERKPKHRAGLPALSCVPVPLSSIIPTLQHSCLLLLHYSITSMQKGKG
jgi:hypothetical protein